MRSSALVDDNNTDIVFVNKNCAQCKKVYTKKLIKYVA